MTDPLHATTHAHHVRLNGCGIIEKLNCETNQFKVDEGGFGLHLTNYACFTHKSNMYITGGWHVKEQYYLNVAVLHLAN